MNLTAYAAPPLTPPRGVADEIRSIVTDAARHAPRSLQTALGPSEIGEPCARKLAYRLMRHTETNAGSDPWPSIVGTAVHAWLADAFLAANDKLGRIRFLVEQRVTIRPGLVGTCDLYDFDREMVIDHKVPGTTSMATAKRNGPSPGYIAQIHLYAYAFAQLGLPVRDVALALYPRGGLLSGLWMWTAPYDQSIARQALARHDAILEAAVALDVEQRPGHYREFPKVVGHACTYCAFWKPGRDSGDGCPGHLEDE
ncbi:MAG TPA: hypothetical protein VFW65_31905 [Pseudonocardiaceae bacterium]|nr:hypothetical protein [Pseudonocardiaceae bacterium]